MSAKQSGKAGDRKKATAKEPARDTAAVGKLPFGPRNYFLFGLGLLTITIGFFTLSKGSITLAPILLVLGYCLIIPLAIVLK